MEAIILAAGRGQRLRPMTDHIPKPLLKIGEKSLIEHHIEKLVKAGFDRLVINLAHLGEKIESALGDGSRYNACISYSREPQGALETGGGIHGALKYLTHDTFCVVNADIFTDFDFADLPRQIPHLAWLLLVENPDHNPKGDFSLEGDRVTFGESGSGEEMTFSGIAVYHRALFAHLDPGRFPLAPILQKAARSNQITGSRYRGLWNDIGTPERLSKVRALVEDR